MKNLSRGCIILAVSTLTSWIGAALDHGNWFGVTSTVLGVIGIFLGMWLAYLVDSYIDL